MVAASVLPAGLFRRHEVVRQRIKLGVALPAFCGKTCVAKLPSLLVLSRTTLSSHDCVAFERAMRCKMKRHRLNTVAWTIAWLVIGAVGTATSAETQFSEPVPNWIWSPEHAAGQVPRLACYFRRVIRMERPRSGQLAVAADDSFELFINGQHVGDGTSDQGIYTFDVGRFLRDGANVIAIRVSNRKGGTAGLATRLVVQRRNQQRTVFASDGSWRTSLSVLPLWNRASYSDRRWSAAKPIGVFSDFVVRQERDAELRQKNESRSVAENEPQAKETKPASTTETGSDQPSTGYRALTKLPAASQHLDVPREFNLEQIAGHQDVGSLIAMTFNEAGQIVASRENGSLVLIDDQNKDGRFDSVRDYAQAVKNCQGLLALNGQVFVVGIGPSGSALYRLSDLDRDGFLDKARAIVKFDGENVEHGPHGMALGADGLIYVIVGNHSKLQDQPAETSPYRHNYEGNLIQPKIEDPGGHAAGVKAPGGFILRTDTEGNQIEIVAGGLRNAYDLAFDTHGEIFTHDSDMESDEGMTWFRPTRLYHVPPGAEFGWRSGWSKWPDYYIDSLPGIADTGRGSPTGIVVYDHHGFPAGYRNRLFSCDWSEGRILMFRLHEQGASYRATPETFIRGEPLNVTDIEVGPDGALYFCTGGRGTAGNIYRVSWKGFDSKGKQNLGEGIDLALRQPQMNSSWGRQNVVRVKQQLGAAWNTAITSAALDPQRSSRERTQALRIMQWLDGTLELDLLVTLSRDQDVEVRRQATYFLGMADDAAAAQRLIVLLKDDDAMVRRRACEALARVRQIPSYDRLNHLFADSDRFQHWSARRLLERIPRRQWQDKVLSSPDMNLFLQGATAVLVADPAPDIASKILQRSFSLMDGFITDEHFTSMLRVQQLALLRGQINPKSVPSLAQRIAPEYPSSSQKINRELVRLLVYAQVSSIMDRYLQELESDSISSPDRYHLAMHLARLRSGWTTEQKLAVFRRLEAPDEGGTNVPGFLQAVAMQFGKSLTAEELVYFLDRGDKYPSAAMSALLRLPDKLNAQQFQQIKALDEKLANQTGETKKRLKIAIVAVLARDGSEPSLAYLRHIYQRDPARRVEVALGLAEHPVGKNWDVLVRSLNILDDTSAKQVMSRMKQETRWPKTSEPYRNVILLAERLGDNGASDAIALLEYWQGFAASDERIAWQKAVIAWKSWYAETFPGEPIPEHSVTTEGGKWDYDSLLRHLTRIEQEGGGSAERGRSVFVKAQCASCHRHADQGESMGPDLTGITRRFLKREILESIIYPSKVISDQYSARMVFTVDGKSYLGIVAPGGADELIVLMTNGQKVRIPESEIDEIEPSRTSAMPEGTLDQLTLEEITDLFTYMSTSGRRLTQRTR